MSVDDMLKDFAYACNTESGCIDGKMNITGSSAHISIGNHTVSSSIWN